MAQFTEFLSNFLSLNRKLTTNKASEILHEAVQKFITYRRKFLIEYNTAMQVICPFENMLQFVNYGASHYTGADKNCVVTNEKQFYEELSKMLLQREIQENDHIDYSVGIASVSNSNRLHNKTSVRNQNFNTFHAVMRQADNGRSLKYQDYIVDNLHAILKSQELLFKNIIKLVDILEKDAFFKGDVKKLNKMKNKLCACRDVLSETCDSQSFSFLFRNIIEEEITRCRFRHGEAKTSDEISLNTPKLEGLASALETPHQNKKKSIKKAENSKIIKIDRNNEVLRRAEIDSEVKQHSKNIIKKASTAIINVPKVENQIIEKVQSVQSDKNLIEINEKYFKQFEDILWHSLTTVKFMSLKEDYINRIKCAFYNKRQFLALESAISNQNRIREENENFARFLAISESMFNITERKLVFYEIKRRINEIHFNVLDNIVPENTRYLPASGSKNIQLKETTQSKHKIKRKNDKFQNADTYSLTRVITSIKNNSDGGVQNSDDNKILMQETVQLQYKVSPGKKLENKKAVNIMPLGMKIENKGKETSLKSNRKKPSVNMDITATKSKQFSQTLMKRDKNDKDKKDEADKDNTEENKKEKMTVKDLANEEDNEENKKKMKELADKDKKLKEYELSRALLDVLKGESKMSKAAKASLSNPAIGGKLGGIKKQIVKIRKKKEIKENREHEAEFLKMSQKAFEEMESTLHTVQRFEKEKNIEEPTNTKVLDETEREQNVTEKSRRVKSSTKINRNLIKKKMSTLTSARKPKEKYYKHPSAINSDRTFVRICGNIQVKTASVQKSKTFLKSASHQCILNKNCKQRKIIIRSKHTVSKLASDTVIINPSLHIRRTTKTVMKKQQVLILPKIENIKKLTIKALELTDIRKTVLNKDAINQSSNKIPTKLKL